MAEFISDNTLTSIGNYRIISFEDPLLNLSSITGFTDEISGDNPPSVTVVKEFRWSVNGTSYSLWMPLTDENLAALPLPEVLEENCCDPIEFWIQLKYTLASFDDESVTPAIPALADGVVVTPTVEICSFELTTVEEFPPEDPKPVHLSCSDEFSTPKFVLTNDIPPLNDPITSANDPNVPYQPYNAINKGTGIYRTLAKDITTKFGHDTVYYRVEPQARSADVVLKEFTIHNVSEKGTIKLLVPDNEFPDNKFNFNSYGIDFEQPFEVHISFDHWETIFGVGSIPRKRDIVHFELLNRFYEVQGVYPYRDFMQQVLYYKAYLVKYQPRTNTIFSDPALEEEIEERTITTEEIFGEEEREEQIQITNPDQLETVTFQSDSTREFINGNLSIVDFNFMNDWTMVSENYYGLESIWDTSLSEQAVAVRYRQAVALGATESLSFVTWFNIPELEEFVERTVASATKLTGDLLELTTTAEHEYGVGDLILLTTNGSERAREGFFEVVSISGSPSDKIVVEDKKPLTDISSVAGWKVKETNVRDVISGMPSTTGIKVQMNYNMMGTESRTEVILKLNEETFKSLLPSNSITSDDINKWYGLVVNVSNQYQQLAFYVWEMQADMGNPQPQTTNLDLIHTDVRSLTPETFSLSTKYMLLGSPIHLTNLRLFDAMIPENDQAVVLNHNLVQDAQRSLIIDNAKRPLLLPKIRSNR